MGVKRRGLLFCACAILSSLCACDEKEEGRGSGPAASASVGVAIVIEGGVALDPPRPSGDLRADLDAFTTVEACAEKRAGIDPLVGDALDAIGYETFLRDACRMLDAMKAEDAKRCDAIDASSLRARCRARVAMVAGRADDCPLRSESEPALGREPACVAAALRSPALCAGEARSRRASCEALVGRDGSKCKSLPSEEKDRCVREAERWRNVLVGDAKLASVPARSGSLDLHGASGREDPPETKVDLAVEVEPGTVLVSRTKEARFELGSLGFAGVTSKSVGPQVRARVALAVAIPAKGDPYIDKLELGVPGGITLSCDGPSAGTKVGSVPCKLELALKKIDRSRGGPIELDVEGRVGSPPQAFEIKLHARSFVRDVVALR